MTAPVRPLGTTVEAGLVTPGRSFTIDSMPPAAQRRFMVEAAAATPYATRPSGEPGTGREAPPPPQGPLNQGRYRDLGEGHAAGWTHRQQAAASRLEWLWKSGRRGWTGPVGYRSGGAGGGGISASDELDAETAAREYDQAMEAVRVQCSDEHRRWLWLRVVQHEPARLGTAHLIREGLTFLANRWGIR